ncbi:hypothetical protein WJX75_009959 [Coccomyxa subellipsoidea]|uniref:NAD(P)-binding protein n=1 Tax=Coccomyxa subellipsoidea TaxID=248742 RepID=A0ABR2Z1U9_9CHLO
MASSDNLAVVVGANRGIGLEISRELQQRGYQVIAACRKTSSELSALPSVSVVEGVDIASQNGCQTLVSALEGRKVALLLVVAGYQHYEKFGDLNADGLRIHFEINAIGPILMAQALRHNLESGSKVVFLASKMGSIGDGRTGGSLYGYRMSKAALNCGGATMARDLKGDGIAVALIHPGAVDTDMCRSVRAAMGVPEKDRSKGLLKADDSARRVLKLVDTLDMTNTGTFWAADTGEVLAW